MEPELFWQCKKRAGKEEERIGLSWEINLQGGCVARLMVVQKEINSLLDEEENCVNSLRLKLHKFT